ncbi:hypothetical protein [Sphingomonas bacterium]|uniref:hypothetical protein n=1 Tax=Sphingomonas bacterium TaxID=1895847 RepID=UPI0015774519|nr:hypothetical protein [Sphingomonas bacterium]
MTDQSDDAPNEILAAAREVTEQGEAAAKALADKAKSWPLAIGIAAGIGSAAIAGAVLYASRDKKRK